MQVIEAFIHIQNYETEITTRKLFQTHEKEPAMPKPGWCRDNHIARKQIKEHMPELLIGLVKARLDVEKKKQKNNNNARAIMEWANDNEKCMKDLCT